MNYCFNWMTIYLYRNGLIDREKFISSWKTVQHIAELSNSLIPERKQNDRLIFSYVRGRYMWKFFNKKNRR